MASEEFIVTLPVFVVVNTPKDEHEIPKGPVGKQDGVEFIPLFTDQHSAEVFLQNTPMPVDFKPTFLRFDTNQDFLKLLRFLRMIGNEFVGYDSSGKSRAYVYPIDKAISDVQSAINSGK